MLQIAQYPVACGGSSVLNLHGKGMFGTQSKENYNYTERVLNDESVEGRASVCE